MSTDLIEGGKDGHLVMASLSKRSPMVQVDREGVVTKQFECLVVMAVHVAHQEVQYGQVHDVQQPGQVRYVHIV